MPERRHHQAERVRVQKPTVEAETRLVRLVVAGASSEGPIAASLLLLLRCFLRQRLDSLTFQPTAVEP